MPIERTYVLVIDDSSTIRTLLANMLSKHRLQVLAAESVELALLDLDRKDFDLVITDIFMPGMGGIEGIEKIRACWPDIKIIAISGGYQAMGKEKALKAAAIQGADRTLTKPFTEEEMMAAIGELLGTGEGEAGVGDEVRAG